MPASLTISGGTDADLAGTLQLSAQAKNAAGQNVAAEISWMSSDVAVATVDNMGVVTGVTRGTVTIQAATTGTSGSISDTHDVTVRVASISLSQSSGTLSSLGDTLILAAESKDAVGGTVAGVSIVFASSDVGVATVDNDGNVVAVGNGSVVITASADTRTANADIEVAQVAVSLSLPASAVTLNSFGDTQGYTATAQDARGNPITESFMWTSTDPSVAAVSGSSNMATATAAGNGTTTIRVERDGFSADATLTVDQQVAAVAVSPATASVLESFTRQLTATPQDARGNTVAGKSVAWSTSDAAVASVDGTGLVTGEAAGTATITASSEGFDGTSVITVNAVTLSLHVQPIFTASCALSGCHLSPAPQMGMDLSAASAFAHTVNVQSNESALLRIKPFDPDASYLVHKIQGTQLSVGGSGARMPLGGPSLSQEQIDTIRAWVTKGAQDN
ncbi:MAG: hypothetical protein GTN78_23140 [Gemmatimonadales bacterium]|nr:hypothetical protein [Gemmatimonadales bacterium]